MRLERPLDEILGQRSKVGVLRYLAHHRDEMSGRGIASDLGMNPWTCHLALRELVDAGVVAMRIIGGAHLFRLRAEAFLVERVLTPLFEAEDGLLDAASREISAQMPEFVVSVILTWPVKDDTRDQLDLLVLVATSGNWAPGKRLLDQVGQAVSARFGIFVSPMVLTVDEFRRRYQAGDSRIRELASAGRIIHGQRLPELLAA